MSIPTKTSFEEVCAPDARMILGASGAAVADVLVLPTDIDHVGHEASAAVDQRDGSIVGVARYVRVADRPGMADVAVEVVDAIQNMGVGTALVARLLDRARANAFRLLTATTPWENRPARLLMRRLRFRARASRGPEIELELGLNPNDCRLGEHTTRSEVMA